VPMEPATLPQTSSSGPGKPPEAGAPDWRAVGEDVLCPLCRYNLRGLAEPRCPECGYRFEWDALLDPAKRLHPYLFEHHTERNVRSFFRTMIGGLLPRRFWRSLQPAMPSRLGRLLVYWLLAALLGSVSVLTEGGRSLYAAAQFNNFQRATSLRFANSQARVAGRSIPPRPISSGRAGRRRGWTPNSRGQPARSSSGVG
jgi:hypothetical protein